MDIIIINTILSYKNTHSISNLYCGHPKGVSGQRLHRGIDDVIAQSHVNLSRRRSSDAVSCGHDVTSAYQGSSTSENDTRKVKAICVTV